MRPAKTLISLRIRAVWSESSLIAGAFYILRAIQRGINESPCHTTVLSTSLRKTFFAWRFILNENILFWLTISYQKPFVFSVSVFYFQICPLKLNLSPEIGLTYAISIVKWFFGIFVLVNIFYFSLLNLNYWCFTTILWKFQKNWTSETC